MNPQHKSCGFFFVLKRVKSAVWKNIGGIESKTAFYILPLLVLSNSAFDFF